MLFVLHESLQQYLEGSGVERERAIVALENIATGRREGKHLLFATYETFTSLVQWSELSERARATYKRSRDRLPQKRTLRQNLVRRIEIVADSYGALLARTEGSTKVIQVPIHYFHDSSLVQQTVLLAENLRDANLYEKMARVSALVLGLGPINVRAEHVGGGGDTTGDHYDRYQTDKGRFCLCIVDSDASSPDGSRGGTARKLARLDDTNQPLCEFLVMRSRELENTIPTIFYGEITNGVQDRVRAVNVLEGLEQSPIVEARNYVDLKRGMYLRELLDFGEGSVEKQFWESKVATLLHIGDSVDSDCVAARSCNSPESCSCRVVQGFGDNILNEVIELLDRTSLHKVAEGVNSAAESEWINLGEVALAWCCGTTLASA
jgi:hypothetical protein